MVKARGAGGALGLWNKQLTKSSCCGGARRGIRRRSACWSSGIRRWFMPSRIAATGSMEKSEELAQETFLRAWRNLRQLDDPGKFRAWLCTIARNLAHTSLRGRRRGAARPLARAAGLSAPGPGPDEAVLARERQEIVWTAVGRIPLKYREPLVLFYRRQRSVSEVAADLGLPEHTVRQRLHRGRQLIKAEVASLVEDTLVRSGPGKTFAVGVIAALPALITPPASAAVAGIAAKGAPAAKTLVGTGPTGAILAPILGLPAAILGAWFSFKRPDSPRQRRFRIRLFIIWWLLLLVSLGLPLTLFYAGLIPVWALTLCLAVYVILLLALIVWTKIGQRRMQNEECPPGINLQSLYGGVGGGIFGATFWLVIQAALAKQWISVAAILACDILIFFVVTRIWIRKLQR
jgi:RNA polymerase sigma factor (sigma-70 family)